MKKWAKEECGFIVPLSPARFYVYLLGRDYSNERWNAIKVWFLSATLFILGKLKLWYTEESETFWTTQNDDDVMTENQNRVLASKARDVARASRNSKCRKKKERKKGAQQKNKRVAETRSMDSRCPKAVLKMFVTWATQATTTTTTRSVRKLVRKPSFSFTP